jgi:hypothetical protein
MKKENTMNLEILKTFPPMAPVMPNYYIKESRKRDAYELKRKVENWFDRTFNMIKLEVYEKMADNYLFEHIRQEPISNFIYDWWSYLDLDEDMREKLVEICCTDTFDLSELKETIKGTLPGDLLDSLVASFEDELREYEQNRGDENYPVWNTLFEFKKRPYEDWIEKAQAVGLGVIDAFNGFETTLFATSAGESFYSAYWIPLYLSLFDHEAAKWEGVSYQHM